MIMDIPVLLEPLLTLGISIIIALSVNAVLRVLKARAQKTRTKIDDIILHAIGRPLYILILVGGLYYAIHQTPFLLDLIIKYDKGYNYRHLIITIFVTWVVASLAKTIVKEYGYEMAARTKREMDDRIVALADMSITYIIWFIGIMVAFSSIGLQITPFLTGMGIAGLAFALAAKNLLSNVFGGLTITLDQLFKVGDRVEMGGVYGDVYDIKPRYTKIRTLNNTIITIPNSKVIDDQIVNYEAPDTSARIKIPITVAYGTDLKQLDEILLEIANNNPLVLKSPEAFVRLTECAPSTINLELIVWVGHYKQWHPVIDLIYREIIPRFSKEGIEMPFNQMDIHIKEDKKEKEKKEKKEEGIKNEKGEEIKEGKGIGDKIYSSEKYE